MTAHTTEQEVSPSMDCEALIELALSQLSTKQGREQASALTGIAALETILRQALSAVRADNAELCRFRLIAENTDDLVVQADREGLATYASPCLGEHLGLPLSEFLGKPVMRYLHPDDVPLWVAALREGRGSSRPLLLKGRWRRLDGTYLATETAIRFLRDKQGEVLGTVAISRGVGTTQALRAQLTRAARTDSLTGALNRAGLTDVLREKLRACPHKPLALLALNLDRFNQINESLGTDAGDQLLKATPARVSEQLRPDDALSRIGADEFVVVLSGIATERHAKAVAERVLAAMALALEIGGQTLQPKASAGLALCTDPDMPIDELRSRANRAMLSAKRKGGSRAEVYNDSLPSVLREAFQVERKLEAALAHGKLAAHFQPIVDVRGGLVAAETLVRLLDSDGALVYPAAFIDVAESSGLIVPLGQWVLKQACLQSRALQERGIPCVVSVNVSPKQLLQDTYVADVLAAVAETGASPCRIMLEITESTVMENIAQAKRVLAALRGQGFKIALDDFGTGYSSIATLKSLPFDVLKIDRSFVRELSSAQEGSPTLASIVQMGRGLGLRLIAEGVETAEQLNYLTKLGCEMLQGFLFARPGSADKLLQMEPSGAPLDTYFGKEQCETCGRCPQMQTAGERNKGLMALA